MGTLLRSQAVVQADRTWCGRELMKDLQHATLNALTALLLRVLVQRGLYDPARNQPIRSMLFLAGNAVSVDMLVGEGADPNDAAASYLVHQRFCALNPTWEYGYAASPLGVARSVEVCRALLHDGADPALLGNVPCPPVLHALLGLRHALTTQMFPVESMLLRPGMSRYYSSQPGTLELEYMHLIKTSMRRCRVNRWTWF